MSGNCYQYCFTAAMQEIDAAGVMFFGHLLNRAHLAYESFMSEIGFSLAELLERSRYQLPLVHCEADFLQPIHHGNLVTIEVQLERLGKTSFTLGYRFIGQAGSLLARVRTVHCRIAARGDVPLPLEAPMRAALTPYQVDE